ncbi:hypothetical protein [Burkholderia multivorans]|uniref:hypothetical protein n=1 Tax=Burkholderia multivorans TaxID=87883 RepID=UPI00130E55A7|nr:hypothetical protein [Burkholderia multivorans]
MGASKIFTIFYFNPFVYLSPTFKGFHAAPHLLMSPHQYVADTTQVIDFRQLVRCTQI